jgi:hypothetical protein
MGFTERASCRPYKNCYKGGAGSNKTRKSKGASSNKKSQPQFFYHTEHITMTSSPEKGKPFGERTVVEIANGKGKKETQVLNKAGKVIKNKTAKLAPAEIRKFSKGNNVPGLFIGV